ncbi:carbon starvation protein A [Luteolibacter algae]|uniref:Carbon starvation protein A n=1 Tax=Luteolibacter algae TaxID=454151 RepID=A0ABW5D7R6_9BACT
MQTLLIAIGSFVAYLIAYHTYGRWLSTKLFKLDSKAIVPSVSENDGTDFVPTPKSVVFGHHFTSIAGTGPIVGPALAVMWGWLPALLWVIFGSIFIGAVHDLGSLVVSLRNKGQTVGDIAGRVVHPRARLLFLAILFLALTMVLAIFGLVIARVFTAFPSSIFPCLFQIPLAMVIGAFLHKKGAKLLIPSLISLTLMYLSVFYGDTGFLHSVNLWFSQWPLIGWVIFLLLYSYAASVMPVWLLLQPRDFINSLQLLTALGLLVAGLVVAALVGVPIPDGRAQLEIVAPVVDTGHLSSLPMMFPFLFITIACGAISGFHCLVSSGTTSKQLSCETDAQSVGYGSMLAEGFLAVIVILACVAGIGLGVKSPDGETLTGLAAWNSRYATWAAAEKGALGAFVQGGSNFITSLGISAGAATALVGVLVASFAATTMDTACRLQRYVIQEVAATLVKHKPETAPHPHVGLTLNPLTWLSNRHGATLFAIFVAFILAIAPRKGIPWTWSTAGEGGLILWPLFGAINQLLGGLAFIVILFWMRRRNMRLWFVAVPAIFMLILPAWALSYQLFFQALGKTQSWIGEGDWFLGGFGIITLLIEIWMIVEAVRVWPKVRGELERQI